MAEAVRRFREPGEMVEVPYLLVDSGNFLVVKRSAVKQIAGAKFSIRLCCAS
jgi:hypothetical protein